MKVEDLKWYSPFVFLVGAVLSFADPITDILTLVEFYRANQTTWFFVGLFFVLFPCVLFPMLYYVSRHQLEQYSNCRQLSQTVLCSFHPFSVAFARLEAFFYFLKKWCGSDISNEISDDLLENIDFAALIESVFESAPQFIIQLYAMSVQEEPVKVIQIISLPVSLLSLAWAFTSVDQIFHKDVIDLNVSLKDKLGLFVTYLFLLSSRLFAVFFFAFSYKAWIVAVFLLHTFVIVTADNIGYWLTSEGVVEADCTCNPKDCAVMGLVYWIRDDLFIKQYVETEFDLAIRKTALRRMQLLSNVMFVLENVIMILLFYFSQQSHTWYTFPVTVCVCSFSVLGSVMRVTLFRVFLKRESDDTVNAELNDNNSPADMTYWISTV